jgi:hypothetical protein
MKQRIKIVWIIIGAAFALGVVLVAIAWSLGARGGVYFDGSGLHYGAEVGVPAEISDFFDF